MNCTKILVQKKSNIRELTDVFSERIGMVQNAHKRSNTFDQVPKGLAIVWRYQRIHASDQNSIVCHMKSTATAMGLEWLR